MAKKTNKYLFLKHKPWWVKLWFFSGLAALLYYLLKSYFTEMTKLNTADAIIMGYGMFSLALFVLIYGFNWK